jgi:hypothetical protein
MGDGLEGKPQSLGMAGPCSAPAAAAPTRPIPAQRCRHACCECRASQQTAGSENGGGQPTAPLWPTCPVSGRPLVPDITHIGPGPHGSHTSQGTPPSCCCPFPFFPFPLHTPPSPLLCCCAVLNHVGFCDVQRLCAHPGACAYILFYSYLARTGVCLLVGDLPTSPLLPLLLAVHNLVEAPTGPPHHPAPLLLVLALGRG